MSLEAEMNRLMDNSPEVDETDDIIEVGVDGVEKPSGRAPATSADPSAPTTDDPNAPKPEPNETVEELRQRAENLKAAMRQERVQRQAEAARARRLEQEYQNAQRNWQDLMTRMASQGIPTQGYAPPQAPQQPGRVDPSQVDLSQLDVENAPIDVLKAAVAKIQAFENERRQAEEAELRERQEREMAQRRQYEQVNQIREIASALRDDEGYFRAEEPSYDDAAAFFVTTRENVLKAAFPAAQPEQIKQAVLDEILQATYQAVNSGRSPAQLIFEAAKSMGWSRASGAPAQGAAPAAAQAQPAAANARVAAPAPAQSAAPATAAGVNPADPLAHIRAGQAAARSAGAGGAAPTSGDLTLKDILSLKGAAYSSASEAFLRKMRQR